MKRLILLSDGTLQDADSEKNEKLLTNVARLSRALKEEDTRGGRAIEQIKLYQSGVGTDEEALGGIVTGALGRGMMQKVKDLYDFICLNWEEGDEIFLFGFSRGAYTVRLLASLINFIGILTSEHMHHLPAIFEALDNHKGDNSNDDEKAVTEIRKLLEPLSRFRSKQLRRLRERREQSVREGKEGGDGWLITGIGVFDTVATRGRPSALRPKSFSTPYPSLKTRYNSFGIDETLLEPCVGIALQALGLDERRIDYLPVIWRRDGEGVEGQKLLQVWFNGAHADVGGGYKEQDLSYLTLTWMVSQLQDHLAFNYDYLKRIEQTTTAPYGQMAPHQSRSGEFRLMAAVDRQIPNKLDPSTNQYFHPSILSQPSSHLRDDLKPLLKNTSLFAKLGPLEQRLKDFWPQPNGHLKPPATPKEEKEPPLVRPVTLTSRSAPAVTQSKPDIHTDSEASSGDESDSHSPSTAVPVAKNAKPPAPIRRVSSVTSFTDNESPPPSPAQTAFSSAPPSPSSSIDSLPLSDSATLSQRHADAEAEEAMEKGAAPEELFPMHKRGKGYEPGWLTRMERRFTRAKRELERNGTHAVGHHYS
ncbi:hypothetical protein JCM11641_005639 [Rhodosporidiobolus odoratus]